MGHASRLVFALALSAGLFLQAGGQKTDHRERQVIQKVEPVYPDLAKRMHITGMVKVEVEVRPNGSVKSTKVLGGNPVLIDSAVEALRKFKFEALPNETTEILQLTFDPH